MTKAELYHQISLLRSRLHIQHYPIESTNLCLTNGIWVDYMPMKTPGLRGIAVMGNASAEQDIILLKESSSAKENNFNCAHELIHLTLHRNNPKKTFQCYESVRNNQNSFEEWQANEGAAELLVPYRQFIPRYVELCRKHRFDRESKVVEELADEFGVLPGVIAFRIDNLNYEIACYLAGTPCEQIPLLSTTEQKKRQIKVLHKKHYCVHCAAVISPSQAFCHVCGKTMRHPSTAFNSPKYGAGYMKYSKIEMDENGRAIVCPRCGNKEPFPAGGHCVICNAPTENTCLGHIPDSPYLDIEERSGPCSESKKVHLPGNARYCPFCGAPTSFQEAQLLRPWQEELQEEMRRANSQQLIQIADNQGEDLLCYYPDDDDNFPLSVS